MTKAELQRLTLLLRSIKVSIDDIKHSIREKSKTAGDPEQPQSLMGNQTIVSLPPAIEGYYETEQHQRPIKERREKTKRIVEYSGIALLAIYTAFTIGMYCANKEAADAARSASITAENALKASKDSSQIDLRAYIGPKFIRMDRITIDASPLTANVRLTNSGRTVGTITTKGLLAVLIGNLPDTKVFFNSEEWRKATVHGPLPIFPGADHEVKQQLTADNALAFLANVDAHLPVRARIPLPPDPIQTVKAMVMSRGVTVYVIGEISYVDVFNAPHQTGYCGKYDWAHNEFGECEGYPDYAN